MSEPRVVVAIPTLKGGSALLACLEALERQTFRRFETVVVDNGGGATDVPAGAARRVIVNPENVGFGAAINQAVAASRAEFVCALNDDAEADEGWLAALAAAAERHPEAGMFASRVVFQDDPERLDSAGLGLYPDGTAKQRGHRRPAAEFAVPDDPPAPSGCAALYRREMLERVGGFDADYFLYGEDVDVALRGRLRGWTCVYAPDAVVRHAYSASAGRASRLKARYVERNRLWTVVKTFPWPLVLLTPLYAARRYWAHAAAAAGGRGLAGRFVAESGKPWDLVLIVWSAHWETIVNLPALLRKRRLARAGATMSLGDFRRLLRRGRVRASEIAAQ